MPNPKRQHSRSRRDKRRTHWKLRLAALGACSHCAKPIIPHRVCPFCGHYKGKPVVDLTAKTQRIQEKKEAKAKAVAQNA